MEVNTEGGRRRRRRTGREVHLSDADPRRAVLSSGLTLLTVRRTRLPVVAVFLMYRAGSLYEPPGKSGLAHLTEHMMFRGTPDHPQGDIDRLVGRLGGSNNAVTTCDHASYYFALPSEHWATPLAIEADRMWHCNLAPGPFETERNVALEERAMLDDDPEAQVFEAVDSLAFGDHPYGHPVVGLAEDLAELSLSDLRVFYREHYTPSEAVLAVVGDIRHEEVRAEAERLFRPGPKLGPTSGRTPPRPASTGVARHARLPGHSPVSRVVIGYPVPPATHPDTAALELLCSLLASGRSSLLYRELIEGSGIATEVSAHTVPQVSPGLLYVAATLDAGGSPEKCEDALLDLVASVATSGVTDADLTRAHNLSLVDVMIARETCIGAAGELAFWESLGRWRLGRERDEQLTRVTRRDIRRVAEAYLDPDARSSAWLTP